MNKLYQILLLASLLLTGVGCSETGIDESSEINVDRTTVSTNKRGMTYEGGTVSFEVTSNVYWVINIDKEVDWLTLSPRAGNGSQTVRVHAQPNTGEARSTILHFDSYDGATAEITIRQGSADELIYYMRTDFGTTTANNIPVGEFNDYKPEGIGATGVTLTGELCYIDTPSTASAYQGASGGNAVRFGPRAATRTETTASSLTIGPINQKGDAYFACKFGLMNAAGAIDPTQVKVQISNDGAAFVDMEFDCAVASSWTEAAAKFYITDPDLMWLRISAPDGYWLDDFRTQEGNEGEGQEIVYTIGGDDGRDIGYIYLQDDFSWITAAYQGSDYISGWPANTAETYWNGVSISAHGQEAYDALINSGWRTSNNKLKERAYLRIGYLKMGRGANVAGCGGGLMTSPINIKKNCAATLRVAFDCCACYSTSGTWDPTTTMQVRIVGDGTINDEGVTEKIFQMSTSAATEQIWRSGSPSKNPWERKEFIVRGATAKTQIIFESVAETTANRWMFDNVKIDKAKADAQPDVDLIPLDAPVAEADKDAATPTSVKFKWNAIENAAAYEYSYTCTHCGQQVDAKSGKTTSTSIEFKELLEGTSCSMTVRAIPAEGDKVYDVSAWSEAAEAQTKGAAPETPDTNPVGTKLFEDDFSWVTAALFGQADFVGTFPANPAGVGFPIVLAGTVSPAAKAALEASGWSEVAKAYLYAGSIKLGTTSATGAVSSPAMKMITPNAKVNAEVTIGATAFLGTNSAYDDDKVRLSIEGEGTFVDGTKSLDFDLGTWNDWAKYDFKVLDINAQTKFIFANRTATRGRVMCNYFSVVKIEDDYSATEELPQLATPEVIIGTTTAYGFDASWAAIPNATDYDYMVVRQDGVVVASGKSWEPRVHIGGLANKTLADKSKYNYFNFRIRANAMNRDNKGGEVPMTYRPSEYSRSVKASLTTSTAAVYFEDDFSWINAASGSAQLATITDWINTYCSKDTMVRLDILENEGIVPLQGWGYDATKKSVYTRPGYIHINSSSAQGELISPLMPAITSATDVEVSFDATYFYQYYSKAADTNKTLAIKLKGSGAIDGATAGTLTVTLDRGNAWQGFSFRITGADATTRVVFAPPVAAKNRVQFDNFRVEAAQ